MPFHDSGSTPQPASQTPLRSTFADDPDMAELVGFFVEEMASRVTSIQEAAEKQDFAQLRMIAHQLKGAGSGYGFEPITKSAGSLEQLIDSVDHDAPTEGLQQQINDLISLCSRVSV